MTTHLHFKQHLLILLLLAVLLIVIGIQVVRFDRSDNNELSHISRLIDTITRLNTESEHKMIAIFIHRNNHNQTAKTALLNIAGQLQQAQQQLRTVLQNEDEELDDTFIIGSDIFDRLSDHINDANKVINTQIQAIHDLAMMMAILTQAEQHFPTLVRQAASINSNQTQRLTTLSHHLIEWQLLSDTALEKHLQQQLLNMHKAGLQDLYTTGTTILRYRTLIRKKIEQTGRDSTATKLALVRATFEEHYAHESHIHLIIKNLLAVMVIALLLYLIALLLGSYRKTLRLQTLLDEKSALQENNRLLLAAMELAPNGILVCNRDGKVLYANMRLAEMHGEDNSQALIGRYAAELRGGERHDSFYHEMIAAIDSGQPWVGEYSLNRCSLNRSTLNRDANTPIIVARTMSCITLDGHRYLVGIDHDISQEREQAAKLEAIQRLESLGVLAGGIAHDFNNILTAIRGNAALAQRNCEQHNVPYLQRIEEGTQRAADLCQQMLAYAGKGKFVIEALNLSTLVGNISKLIAISINSRIKLTVNLATTLSAVEGDRTQLQQIVLNLITNANEAIINQPSWTDGAITISTIECDVDAIMLKQALCGSELQPGRYIILDVTDDGCGMDQATIQRMFEPFFTTKFTGRGLGMSAILGIVQSHHGALLLDSEPGEGSHFQMLLPPTDKPIAETSPPITIQQKAPLSGLILIIDDEEVIREMTSEVLNEIGLRTITAADGAQGVECFRQRPTEIDAVLLDMTMPVMDGEACFKALCAIREDIAVVVASGYAEQDVFQAFGKNRLAGFLHKPFNPEALQQMMQKIVIANNPS